MKLKNNSEKTQTTILTNLLHLKSNLTELLGETPNNDSIFNYTDKFASIVINFRKTLLANLSNNDKVNKNILKDLYSLICHITTLENDLDDKRTKLVQLGNRSSVKIFTKLDTNPMETINYINNIVNNVKHFMSTNSLLNKLVDAEFKDNFLFIYKDPTNTLNRNYRTYSRLFDNKTITEEQYRAIKYLTYSYILNYRDEILRLINLIIQKSNIISMQNTGNPNTK